MEERKRPATYENDESAPPLKRQATAVNGASKSHIDAEMPWKDDLDRFQKEAILRQKDEYKREKNSLESRLNEMGRKAAYHDEHLMIIDAWFGELVDEVRLLAGAICNTSTYTPFPSALLDADTSIFNKHLKSRSSEISSAIATLLRSPTSTPDIVALEARITELLAAEKAHIIELEKSRLEQAKLEERLEDAALRYMRAEKKLDRSKSASVAKLEKEGVLGGRDLMSSSGGGTDTKTDPNTASGEQLVELDAARREATTESSKRKEQLESLELENAKLTSQITQLTIRLSHLSDDDYAKSDLFKQLRSTHEEVIKRINDLEATNVKLREEAERLQAERTTYRMQLEQETEIALAEKEAQLAQAENDLARVRKSRDEQQTEVSVLKAAENQDRVSINQVKELISAKEDRLKALESEIARQQLQIGQSVGPASPPTSLDGLSTDELQSRCGTLEKQAILLNTELQSMGSAFKKASALASSKISNLSGLEDKIQRLGAEKVKADQKYFATMKTKEAREQEVRSLRAQNTKAAEIVSSLKDSEAANRSLQVSLEKQIVEVKEALSTITVKLHTANSKINDRTINVDGLRSQVEELKAALLARDESTTSKSVANRANDIELEKLKVRLEETKKQLETWKTRGQGVNSVEYEGYRQIAICTICHVNFKNTVIKHCGHVFCDKCVEDRTQLRQRRCPNCNKSFGANDVMRITL